jgi:hypothetical protein
MSLHCGSRDLVIRCWPPVLRVMSSIPAEPSKDFSSCQKTLPSTLTRHKFCDVRNTRPTLWFGAHVKLSVPSSSHHLHYHHIIGANGIYLTGAPHLRNGFLHAHHASRSMGEWLEISSALALVPTNRLTLWIQPCFEIPDKYYSTRIMVITKIH